MNKICNTCKESKELEQFHIDKKRNIRFNKCKECYKKEYKIKHNIPLDKDISPRPRQIISEDFITNLDIKENIYLLGLLWADGYVSKTRKQVTYVCTSDDFIYSIDIFKKFGVVNTYTYQPKTSSKTNSGIQINDGRIYDFLVENDYLIKSGASADKILSKIPEHLQHYWWRGYFDGDGCAHIDKRSGAEVVDISFGSCIGQDWNFAVKLFNKLIIQKYTIRSGGKIARKTNKVSHFSGIAVTKSNEVYKFFNYIYPQMKYDGLGYKRKFDKLIVVNNTFGKTRTNKYEGIRYNKKSGKWNIFIKIDRKTKIIGSDISEDNAYKRQQEFLNKLIPSKMCLSGFGKNFAKTTVAIPRI